MTESYEEVMKRIQRRDMFLNIFIWLIALPAFWYGVYKLAMWMWG